MWQDIHYLDDYETVIGIDEVGRGSIAGPVAVGACVLKIPDKLPVIINDSKALARWQREAAASWIEATFRTNVSFELPNVIDNEGINTAIERAANCCLRNLVDYKTKSIVVLFDGDRPLCHTQWPFELIVKGDKKCFSIACASIIAKVARDNLMRELSRQYPAYNWRVNYGYGSRKHLLAIRSHGLSPHHRRTFVHF